MTRVLLGIANGIHESWLSNRAFVLSLPRHHRIMLCLLLLAQAVAYFYFLLNIPLHFDEWQSWRFFSGQDYWTTLSTYPVPNNHVFYNLAAGTVARLPLDPEIALRIPSFIASFLTTYYFFKICKQIFPTSLSLALMMLVGGTYPFVLFSFAARGYGFVNLFCVTLIYSSLQLVGDYRSLKYRILLVLSLFLGLWSVPSFLYVAAPIGLVLVFFVRRIFLLAQDALLAAGLTLAAYSIILWRNPRQLFNPNEGAGRFSILDDGALRRISSHLESTFEYLFQVPRLFVPACVLISVSAVYFVLRNRDRQPHFFMGVLSFVMFVSPFFLLAAHQVIPFERTWAFMVFPVILSVGMMLMNVSDLLGDRYRGLFARYGVGGHALVLAISVMLLSGFTSRHVEVSGLDFETDYLRRTRLETVIRQIRTIGLTNQGMEFYPAWMIANICFKYDPTRAVRVTPLGAISDQDLLVFHATEVPKYVAQLNDYVLLQTYDENLSVYGKRTLFGQ